jgi:hypothetical protein
VKEVVNALCRDVSSYIPKDEMRLLCALPAAEAIELEPIIQVDELGRGDPELISEPGEQIPRWRDKEIDLLRHFAHVRHAPGDPVGPVCHVSLALVVGAGEIARIAALRALAVVLSITERPQILRNGRVHLHELASRAHQPVIVEGEDDRHTSIARLIDDGRGQVV